MVVGGAVWLSTMIKNSINKRCLKDKKNGSEATVNNNQEAVIEKQPQSPDTEPPPSEFDYFLS